MCFSMKGSSGFTFERQGLTETSSSVLPATGPRTSFIRYGKLEDFSQGNIVTILTI